MCEIRAQKTQQFELHYMPLFEWNVCDCLKADFFFFFLFFPALCSHPRHCSLLVQFVLYGLGFMTQGRNVVYLSYHWNVFITVDSLRGKAKKKPLKS